VTASEPAERGELLRDSVADGGMAARARERF
jgi:hypothetical protein